MQMIARVCRKRNRTPSVTRASVSFIFPSHRSADRFYCSVLGGVFGALGGFILIAALVWWFRPAHRRRPSKLTYGEGEGEEAEQMEKTAPHSIRNNPHLMAGDATGQGDFNLSGVAMRSNPDWEVHQTSRAPPRALLQLALNHLPI